ncbi:MAG TPA: hypothetical protein DEQ47_17075 [Solibacterales bacterium]|nr:hypothetical protein [Bryobacterales bacterium]
MTAMLLTAVLFLLASGCKVSKVQKLDVSQVQQPQRERLVGITTKAGAEVSFDRPGGTISQEKIEARVKAAPYSIALQDVQRLWVERQGTSASRTIGLTVLIAAAAFGTLLTVALLTKQSCPFVYSWDGTRYVFDAEPYGGAITRGLERDDYSELEHLRAENGVYRLLLTNEVDETQYTNLMELLVADYARGSRVVSDEHGALRTYTQIQQLSAARDRYGNDLLPWLLATDRKIWEPDTVAGPDGSLRQEVVLTFPKPENATQVTLIANAATGLWGSYMIKRIVELHGRDSAAWLASLDSDPAGQQAIHAWGEREGTYRLPIEVEEAAGWVVRGALPNGGPLLAEDRAIVLDVSRVRGSQLRLRLRPPVGFWAFNSFALASGAGEAVSVVRVAASSARTADGRDIRSDLATTDNRYYPMPDNTDQAEITFRAPAAKAGQERTVFLHSRGWYQLHLRNKDAPDPVTLSKILTVPGAAVQFAADRFAEWGPGVRR